MADLKRPKGDNYIPFFKSLLTDVERLTGLDLTRDALEIEHRGIAEGLSFLTKTMPAYYKHVLRCVELGSFQPIVGFKHRRSGPLPLFLQGLVLGLFAEDGNLRLDRESHYLGYIGQICTFMYKCEFPYTPEQEAQRLEKFKEVEEELPETLGRLTDKAETILLNAMEFGRVLLRGFSISELPKNGPGSVAGGEKAEEKYGFRFSERIEDVFPFDDWFATRRTETKSGSKSPPGDEGWACDHQGHIVSTGELLELLDNGRDLGWDFGPARGLFVNKDSRGPRYISCEPKELMWLQQAVGQSLSRHVETHPDSTGHVNFRDQSINGDLARRSSIDRRLATVDLEDASDRVSLAVVRLLFPSNLARLLEACRSNSARLPDGSTVQLKKFAPMGSACCFPVESVVFYLLTTACVSFLTGWDFRKSSRDVYVYGDDILCPRFVAPLLMEIFPEFHLAVNVNKSFLQGPFRESCGVDAIDGFDVSTVKLRRPEPVSKGDTSGLISWAETSNQLFYAGFWVTADYMASRLREYGPISYVPYQSGVYGLTGYQASLEVSGRKIKWDRRHQVPKVKVRRVTPCTYDWSHKEAPGAATLHTLVKGTPDWSIVGRSEVSTLLPQTSERLSLKYSTVSL